MRLGLVLLALFGSMADARPPRRPPPPDLEPFKAEPACDRKKTWSEIEKCLGATARVLREDATAKLVALSDGPTKPLRLYVLNNSEWQLTSYTGAETAMTELLGFKQIAAGVRIDQGHQLQSSATIGLPGTPVRIWLRRRLTTVCFKGSTVCRTIITACDAMIDGKSYWSFHGTVHEKDKTLYVVGDRSRGGSHCVAPRHSFREDELGPPLE